jgi:hypothetical protein
MIVPSPAGMQAAAFNIGRLAVCSYFPLPGLFCSYIRLPVAYKFRLIRGSESGVEEGTVSEGLTLQIVQGLRGRGGGGGVNSLCHAFN